MTASVSWRHAGRRLQEENRPAGFTRDGHRSGPVFFLLVFYGDGGTGSDLTVPLLEAEGVGKVVGRYFCRAQYKGFR